MANTPHHDDDRPQAGRPRSGTGHTKSKVIPIRLAGIDTVPMTDQEFDDAVEALAVLLNHFRRDHPSLAA